MKALAFKFLSQLVRFPWWRGGLVFLGFTLISALFTWPWALYFGRSTFGAGHPFIVIWRFWWNNFALQNHLDPSFTSLVGAPFGSRITDLADPVLPFFVGHWLTRLLSDPVLAYNFIVFLSFPLSAYFTFILIRYLTKRNWLAFLVGLLFAFSPYHLNHLGQFSLASVQFLPLLIYAFLKLREKPTLRRSLLLGVTLAVNALTDYYYGYFSGLFLISFLSFEGLLLLVLKRVELPAYFRRFFYYFIAGVLTFVIVGAVVYPRLFLSPKETRSQLPLKASFDDLIVHSARPWDYFLPSLRHPLFGEAVTALKKEISRNQGNYWFYRPQTTEAEIFLGWSVFFLALLALFLWLRKRGWRKDVLVPTLFLTALLLMFASFPPDIYLGKNSEIHKILLSFRLHQLFPMFRAYGRLGVLVLLCFLLLAAGALKEVQESCFSRKGKILALSLFVLLLIIDFATPPFRYLDVFNSAPDVYRWLSDEPQGTLVAEMPEFRYFGNCSSCLLFQRFHRQPLYGSSQLVYYDYVLLSKEDGSLLPGGEIAGDKLHNEAIAAMRSAGVKYLLVPRRARFRLVELPDFPWTGYPLGNFAEKLRLVKTFSDAYVFEVTP